jgi:c-di-GMP-binding flagellar brake protein YcgR
VRTHPSGVALCGCSYASITNQARQQLASFVYERLRTDR